MERGTSHPIGNSGVKEKLLTMFQFVSHHLSWPIKCRMLHGTPKPASAHRTEEKTRRLGSMRVLPKPVLQVYLMWARCAGNCTWFDATWKLWSITDSDGPWVSDLHLSTAVLLWVLLTGSLASNRWSHYFQSASATNRRRHVTYFKDASR